MTPALAARIQSAPDAGIMRRVLIVIATTAAALTVAIVTAWVYWLISVQSVSAATDRWIASMLESGYDINIGRRSFRGFPHTAEVILDEVEALGSDHILPWTWSISRVRVSRTLSGPNNLRIRPSGIQTIVYEFDEELHAIRLGAARWIMTVATELSGTKTIRTELARFVWAPEGEKPTSAREIELALRLPVSNGAIPKGTQINLKIVEAKLPAARTFGTVLETLEAATEVAVAVPAGDPWSALLAWSGNDGFLAIKSGTLKWGALDTQQIRGNLGLDEKLRPLANLAGEFHGFRETLYALNAANRISDWRLQEFLFSLRAAEEAGRSSLMRTLSFNGGTAMIDATSVGRVPKLLPETE